MKKLISLIGAGALLLSIVTPVLAHGGGPRPMGRTTIVNNYTEATAITGGNSIGNVALVEKAGIGGEVEAEGTNIVTLRTGEANADAIGVVVTDPEIGCSRCGRRSCCQQECCPELDMVTNTTIAGASTGGNTVGNLASVEKAHVSGEVEAEGNNTVTMTTGAADAEAIGVVVTDPRLSWGMR